MTRWTSGAKFLFLMPAVIWVRPIPSPINRITLRAVWPSFSGIGLRCWPHSAPMKSNEKSRKMADRCMPQNYEAP